MPINPEIALQVKPLQGPDVMQAYGNALQMKSHIQNQQLQQMQMQTMDLENQQRKMQMEALKEYNAAMKEGYGGNDPATPTAQPQAPPAAAPQESPRAPDSPVSGGTLDPNTPASVRGAGAMNALAGPAPGSYGLQDALTPPQNPPTFKAPAASPAPAQPMATPANQPAPNNGIPTVDYDKVARRLIQNGQGSQVMGLLSTRAKYMQELALQHKTEAEGHADQLAQVAQAFQGVNGAPPDQKDAVYEQALRMALPMAKTYGIDSSRWPMKYDPATTPTFVDQVIGHATKLADFARQTHEAADMARIISAGIPKTAKDLGDAYDSDVSQAGNQADLDQKNQKWAAIANADPTGQTAKLYAAVKQSKWSPEISQDATISALKPDERVKYFTGQLNDSAQRLKSAALRGQAAYTAELGRQVGKNADLGNLFPAPPAPGEAWDGKAVATQAASVGATGEQYITAQNTTQWREQLADFKGVMAGIAQQNADSTRKRADETHDTGWKHNAEVSELTSRAIADAGGLDAAIQKEQNVEVLKQLKSLKRGDLAIQKGQADLDKANPPGPEEIVTYRKAHPGASISAAKAAIVAARHGGSSGTPTPKAAPQPTSTGNQFPRARLADFATANQMTTAQAEAALKAQGYTVN